MGKNNPYLRDGRYRADSDGEVKDSETYRDYTNDARDMVRDAGNALKDMGRDVTDAARDLGGSMKRAAQDY